MNIGERKLSLKNMLNYILSKWYVLIISAVIFGVALTGGKYILDRIEENKKNQKAPLEEVEEKLEDAQIVDVEYAASVDLMLEEWKIYLSNSELMNIDPYKTKKNTVKYYVSLDGSMSVEEKENLVVNIVSAFVTYIDGGDCLGDVVDEYDLNIDKQYLEELITVGYVNSNEKMASFTISVYETENTEGLIDKVTTSVDDYKIQLENIFGEFSLTVVDSHSSLYYEADIESKRNGVINNINTYEKRLLTLLEGFSDDQMKYYCFLTNDEEEAEEIEVSIFVLVLGMFVGVAFAAVVCIFLWFSSNTIVDENDYESMIGSKLLGTIINTNGKKLKIYQRSRYKNFIDQSYEMQLENAVTNIRIACKKSSNKNITLVSSCNELVKDKLKDLKNLLKKYNIEADISTREELKKHYLESKVDACVEVEVLNKSKVQDVYNIVSLAQEMEITVIGVVNIVEG